MDDYLKRSMCDYYDERAPEYEDVYRGSGPASIADPDAYKSESAALSELVGGLCKSDLIDIACGTGFWLPHYSKNCSAITLFDQSPKMLAESKRKAEQLGISDRCTFVRGDYFDHAFEPGAFDMAVIGFLLSHIPDELEQDFFQKLKNMLKPDGSFLILDSIWNNERAKTRDKIGRHQRKLSDGRTFEIYKRYFVESDFRAMASKYELSLSIAHTGRVFIAAIGKFAPKN